MVPERGPTKGGPPKFHYKHDQKLFILGIFSTRAPEVEVLGTLSGFKERADETNQNVLGISKISSSAGESPGPPEAKVLNPPCDFKKKRVVATNLDTFSIPEIF